MKINTFSSFERLESSGLNDIKFKNWPIWDFFKHSFYVNKLPSIFPDLNNISDFEPKSYNKYKFFVSLNEKMKRVLSKKQEIEESDVVFGVHTNALFKDENEWYVDRIGGVVDEVKKSRLNYSFLTFHPISHKVNLSLKKYPGLIYGFMDKLIMKKSKKEAKRIVKEWNEFKNEFNAENKKDLYRKIFSIMDFYFSKPLVTSVISTYLATKKVVEKSGAELFCTYGGRAMTRASMAAFHDSGKKSLHIQHGFLSEGQNKEFPPSCHHAVIGDKIAEDMVNKGVDEDRIHVAGPVFFDEIFNVKKTEANDFKNITFFTPGPEARVSDEKYFQLIKDILVKLNNIEKLEKIFVKIHPRDDDFDKYKQIASKIPKNIEIYESNFKEDLYDLILKSRLVVGFYSTTLMESMILERPSIIFIPYNKFIQESFLEDDGLVKAFETSELLALIDNIFKENEYEKILADQEKFLKDWFYKLDGKESKRVLSVIKNLLNS